MAELRTEEEQVEALKRWWDENGKSLLAGIAIAILGVVGWNYYQDQQQVSAETASAYYQRLLGNATVAQVGDAQVSAIKQDAATLKTEFEDSAYAQYAALMLAKLAVQADDLTQAENELRWVVSQVDADTDMAALASVRLAQVLHAQGRSDQALALLVDADDVWQGRRQEVKGDILLSQGDKTGARKAFAAALQVAQDQGANAALLNLKLDNLAD